MLSGTFSVRHFYEEGNVGHLIIRVHIIFSGKSVFSQHMTVVRGQNHQSILIQPIFLQGIEETAQPPVRHGHGRQIAFPQMAYGLLRFCDRRIPRPVELLSAVIVPIQFMVGVRCIERFMRVERLNHQKEIIRSPVLLGPAAGGQEGGRSRICFLPARIFLPV